MALLASSGDQRRDTQLHFIAITLCDDHVKTAYVTTASRRAGKSQM